MADVRSGPAATSWSAGEATRLPVVDVLRFVAALAVIWWHTPERPQDRAYIGLVTWSVPFFAGLSAYLLTRSMQRNPERRFAPYLGSRLVRIAAPFVGWSVIYLLTRDFEKVYVTREPLVPLRWSMLWTGTAHHLWFLPFILMLSAVLFLPLKYTARRPSLRGVLAIGCVAIGAWLAVGQCPFDSDRAYLLMQTWHALPAALWSVASASYLVRLTPEQARCWRPASVVLALSAVAANVVAPSALAANAAGALLVVTAGLPWQVRWQSAAAGWGRLAYGIYLVHVLFLIGLRLFSGKVLHIEAGPPRNVLVFLGTCLASIAACWLLRQSRWTAWLAPS